MVVERMDSFPSTADAMLLLLAVVPGYHHSLRTVRILNITDLTDSTGLSRQYHQ